MEVIFVLTDIRTYFAMVVFFFNSWIHFELHISQEVRKYSFMRMIDDEEVAMLKGEGFDA